MDGDSMHHEDITDIVDIDGYSDLDSIFDFFKNRFSVNKNCEILEKALNEKVINRFLKESKMINETIENIRENEIKDIDGIREFENDMLELNCDIDSFNGFFDFEMKMKRIFIFNELVSVKNAVTDIEKELLKEIDEINDYVFSD